MFHATYSRAPSAAAAIAKIPYAICSASNSMMLRVGVHTITDAPMTTALMIIAVMIAFFISLPFLILLVYHPLPTKPSWERVKYIIFSYVVGLLSMRQRIKSPVLHIHDCFLPHLDFSKSIQQHTICISYVLYLHQILHYKNYG